MRLEDIQLLLMSVDVLRNQTLHYSLLRLENLDPDKADEQRGSAKN